MTINMVNLMQITTLHFILNNWLLCCHQLSLNTITEDKMLDLPEVNVLSFL